MTEGTQYTVRQFIRLTPPQKMRLKQRDPKQYDDLMNKMKKEYPKETDVEILTQLETNPKTKK